MNKSKELLDTIGHEYKNTEKYVDKMMKRVRRRQQPRGITGFIRQNPWSIAVAVLLLGAVVGLAVTRPRRSQTDYTANYPMEA